jgi:hypothetical protein
MIDGHMTHLELWQELLATGRSHAAVGLLFDLFCRLNMASEQQTPPASLDLIDDVDAGLRETLMQILDDRDGQTLQHWMQLYRKDQPSFEYYARSLVKESRSRLLEK